MSSKLQFKVFFGEGSVGYGPNGINLSGFKCTQSGIDKPGDRSFVSIYKWLECGFCINPETHVLTVQTVVTWANEGVLWELMLIRNTADWKMYMEAAFERGWPLAMLVQTHEKPQVAADEENEGSQSAQREGDQAEEERRQETHVTETEPQGQVDEGERISRIVEQMQIEDEEAEQIEQRGDSSDEEGEQVPAEWSEQGLGNYMIHDGRGLEWEYRENEVVQGSKYPTIDAVKEAVKL